MSIATARRPRAAVLALALAAALGAGVPAAVAAPKAAAAVDIPYEQFTLPNGLRVLVHTDRKAPIVSVNIWYHVGSKDEPAGRSGFAHLFEHLMFQASENHKGEYFAPFKQIGVTGQNGTTNTDRTNYFQNVPTTALDTALWMESDRMGHLLGAVTQQALDEQRGVVQNEKRQGENQPYGQAWDVLSRALYPKTHPYHRGVIGSMNDLNAASLDDVKTWFRTWYGPNNAVLVLAGDIDLATAKQKAMQYFGHIPAGPTMAQPKVDVARRSADTRQVMTDKVPQARVYRVWNVPQYGSAELDRLKLLSGILGGSGSSRLDARLVHRDKLVDNVAAFVSEAQLGSNFGVMATVKQGVDPAKVEAIIEEELTRLLAEGPTAAELERAKTVQRAAFIRGVERIGGFGGKADALAECAVYTGKPSCFRDTLATIAAATPAQVQAAGRAFLDTGSHTLVIEPGARVALEEEPAATPKPFTLPAADRKFKAATPAVDRSTGVPMPQSFPDLKFPALQRATLSNGTTVVLAERHDVPVVQMNYMLNGGFASDAGGKAGTAAFAMAMLSQGAGDRDALAFADASERLGANLGVSTSLDGGAAYLSALKENLDASLALYADMLRRPRFEVAEVERVKSTRIAGIRQEKVNPNTVAFRVMPTLLYGAQHAYGAPMTGTGTEASIAAIGRDDLLAFQRNWLRPEGATLVVVGDTTLAEIVPMLERHFGDWKGEGPAPKPVNVASAERPKSTRVYLIDQPGAVQANLFVGQLVPPTTDPGAIRLEFANGVFGGDFTSRLNMNLREDKHWSYGARSQLISAIGPRPWLAIAPVQIDKTAEAMAEMQREIVEYASGQRPPEAAEVERIRKLSTLSLPGAYETASSVMSTVTDIVRYGRPDDYVVRRKAEFEAMTPDQVKAAAAALDPKAMTWVVVGDLKQTEAKVRALNLGEVIVIDADGKPVTGASAAR